MRRANSCSLASASPAYLSVFALAPSAEPGEIRALHASELRCRAPAADLSWLPGDNGIIVSTHTNGTVQVWDTSRLEVAHTVAVPAAARCHAVSPAQTMLRASVAVGSAHGLRLVDLRTGSALQAGAGREQATALLWDILDEFQLYGGGASGALCRWDVRRLDRVVAVGTPVRQHAADAVVQLAWLGSGHVVAVQSSGFLSAITLASGEVLWRTDLGVECLDGFRAALVEDTPATLVLVPGGEEVRAYDSTSGELLFARAFCGDVCADALTHNEDLSVSGRAPSTTNHPRRSSYLAWQRCECGVCPSESSWPGMWEWRRDGRRGGMGEEANFGGVR